MVITITAILFSLIVAHAVFGWLPLEARTLIFSGTLLAYMVAFLRQDEPEFFYGDMTTETRSPVQAQPRMVPTVRQEAVQSIQPKKSEDGGFYAREAAYMERLLLDDYKISCVIGRVPFKSHTYVGYPIALNGSKTLAAIEPVLETLASRVATTKARSRVMPIDPRTGERTPVDIRLDRTSQPPILQVTRPRIKYLDWAGTETWQNDPMDVVFGCKVVYDREKGGRIVPATVPMADTDRMSYLFLGVSQSGKSTLMNAALVRLLRANSPKRLKVWICDPKGVFFRPYADVAHVQEWTDNIADASIMLKRFLDICSDGNEEGSETYKLLIIDEWHRIARTNPELISSLNAILNSGATKNIRVWVATTETDIDTIPQSMKNSFHVIVSCYNRNDRYVRDTLKLTGTSGLIRRYEAIMMMDSFTSRISTFNFTDDIFLRELSMLPKSVSSGDDRPIDRVLPQEEIQEISMTEVDRVRRAVIALSEDQSIYYGGRMSIKAVHGKLYPGKGKNCPEYDMVCRIVKEANGE